VKGPLTFLKPRRKPAAAPLAPAVDPDRLEMLRELGRRTGQDLLPALVRTFSEQAPGKLQAIEDALRAGDLPQAGLLAHGLRGTSANLGAAALATALEAFESSLGDAAAARGLLPGLDAELARTLAELAHAAAG
jgi:two-component system sensor histidine kinase/response regulator